MNHYRILRQFHPLTPNTPSYFRDTGKTFVSPHPPEIAFNEFRRISLAVGSAISLRSFRAQLYAFESILPMEEFDDVPF